MKFKRTLSLFTLAAVSATVVSCGTRTSNFPDPNFENNISSFSAAKTDPYANLKNGDVIPGEFIVKFKPGAKQKNASNGSKIIQLIGGSNSDIALVKASDFSANSISGNRNLLWSEPNRVIKLPGVRDIAPVDPGQGEEFPNDEMFSKQYSHKVANSVVAWNTVKDKVGEVIIAVTDTGVDVTHPDLKGKVVPGYTAYPGDPETKDLQGHGTHVAGITAAMGDNKIGVAGVGMFHSIKIQPVKVLDSNGSGTYAGVADGMIWAATHGAKVMNMSLGGPSSSKALEEAVAIALKNDVLVVVAMGNDGNSSISYPAGIKGVMAIGATNSADKIASFSQYGKHISVSAPGVKILSTFPQYQNGIGQINYGSISGTSMSTPFVAGLAGLLRATKANLTAAQTRSIIEKSVDDLGNKGFDIHYGFGRVNVGKAVASLSR